MDADTIPISLVDEEWESGIGMTSFERLAKILTLVLEEMKYE